MSVEDWDEIRRLHKTEGLPIKMIARTLGVSRNTVRAALASDGPPRYARKPTGSAVDAFVVSTIHQRLRDEHGLTVSLSSLRRYLAANLPEEMLAAQVTVLRQGHRRA